MPFSNKERISAGDETLGSLLSPKTTARRPSRRSWLGKITSIVLWLLVVASMYDFGVPERLLVCYKIREDRYIPSMLNRVPGIGTSWTINCCRSAMNLEHRSLSWSIFIPHWQVVSNPGSAKPLPRLSDIKSAANWADSVTVVQATSDVRLHLKQVMVTVFVPSNGSHGEFVDADHADLAILLGS